MKKCLFIAIASMVALVSYGNDMTSAQGTARQSEDVKKVVVLSDIHMCDERSRQGGWGWFDKRRPVLINFLNNIAQHADEYGEVVVAGDMFDEWVAPMDKSPYQNLQGDDVRTESDFFQVLVRDNKEVLDAFRAVRDAGIEVVYVPGNHDLTCTKEDFDTYLPGLFTQARDAYGLGAYSPAGMPEVVIEHGHRYDYNNMPNPISTPGGYYPIGYVVSKYASTLKYTAPSVTQNTSAPSVFNSVDGIRNNMQAIAEYEQYLDEHGIEERMNYQEFCNELEQILADADKVKELLDDNSQSNGIIEQLNHFAANAAWAVVMIAKPPHSFGQLLDVLFTEVKFPEPYEESYLFWDILPYFHKSPLFQNLWTNENWARIQATNKVAVPLPFIRSILAGGIDAVLDGIAPTEYFDNPDSDKRIVVFGHTHKGMIVEYENTTEDKCLYANTGCWVDDPWGDPDAGVTFQTYIELDRKDGTYVVTLKEWGKPNPIAVDSLCVVNDAPSCITSLATDKSEGWYSMQGVRLNSAPSGRGIYIKNGKKMLKK